MKAHFGATHKAHSDSLRERTISKAFVVFISIMMAVSMALLSEVAAAKDQREARNTDQEAVYLSQSETAARSECTRVSDYYTGEITAWQRRNQAENMGYKVGEVFPCADDLGLRRYCFEIFYSC